MTANDTNSKMLVALRRLHEATAADFAGVLVQAIADLTGTDVALLLLVDAEGVSRLVASRGLEQHQAEAFSAPIDPALPARLRNYFGFATTEELMAVPLRAGEDVRGLLVARQPRRAEAARILIALSDHAALALERIDKERRLVVAEQTAGSAQEEKKLLRAILHSLPAALWLTDSEGRPKLASDKARELAPGIPWFRPGETTPSEREPPLGRAQRERVSEEEWLLATTRGYEIPLLCSAAPLRDHETGALLGAVLLGQDLRHRKEEEAGQRQQVAQEEAGKAKDLFFNALSHELRTPLAAILFALEVLQHADASPSQKERASRTIARNVQHQVRLIDDLLDISRIMRRRAHIERRPVELCELLAARVGEYQDMARRAGLSLAVELPTCPMPVLGDPARLEQVVSILVDNAIKFTSPGGSVRVRLVEDGAWASLSVRDTGSGIAPDVLPHLFQPLQQGDRSLSRSRGGLGAGLAIARWVVEQHGGQTAAHSAGPGEGSEFVVRLPVRKEVQPAVPEVAQPAPDLSSRRVLVVEDNHDLLDTLLALLEMLGHHVVPAPDGTSALEAAQREHPEVAFIDIGLPDMDGYELARRLRADQALRGMRLVALTGYASEDHREKALRAGFDDYLAKPVDMETIKLALTGQHRQATAHGA